MIVIIPARGGSKGLPGKNTRLFAGKPLLAHTVAIAQQAPSLSRIVVSTDCPHIAAVARQYGAECPFLRPAELASDQSAAVDAYLYTLRELEARDGKEIDELAVLLPTAPLRVVADIEAAMQIFRSKRASSVVSFVETHPPAWTRGIGAEGQIVTREHVLNGNRQDYGDCFVPNGSIYLFKRSLLEQRLYYAEDSYAYLMPKARSVDIDTLEDFELAERLFQESSNAKAGEQSPGTTSLQSEFSL